MLLTIQMLQKVLPLCQLLALTMGQFNGGLMIKRWPALGSQVSGPVLKRDAAVGTADQTEYIEVCIIQAWVILLVQMCERTSAMFAIRACRLYCMKNYQSYPDQCGVPGTAGTVIEMANQMRKMVTIEYCQNQYDQAIQKCLKMLS